MALDSYDGHVDDIDLALWRGAYRIDGIRIVKTGAEHSTPFFSADRVDFSVEWRSLMRGRHHSATVAPMPRRNVRRGSLLFAINITRLQLRASETAGS